jgi:hypothetical protein
LVRTPGAIREADGTVAEKAVEPFVADTAADAIAVAELGHGVEARRASSTKSRRADIGTITLQGVGTSMGCPRLIPSVTYVSGPYREEEA